MSDRKKIAVVLFSIGGPLKKADIKPYLFNFFFDKNIINAPLIIRYLLAKYISIKRSKNEALESYAHLNFKSPLLENTKKQAEALELELKNNKDAEYKCFVAMRYWHPFCYETVKEIEKYNPDKVILLPFYPQYSFATSYSSIEDFYKKFKNKKIVTEIKNYPENDGFISASVKNIQEQINKLENQKYRILFSAHGLPEENIKAGDPYKQQCELTMNAIVKKLNIDNLDYNICFQSKVGSKEWIKPYIQDELKRAANDKIGVIIYPIAFVSEHVETLVELDIEYKELAKKLGVPFYKRVKTVGDSKKFIEGLKNLVISK